MAYFIQTSFIEFQKFSFIPSGLLLKPYAKNKDLIELKFGSKQESRYYDEATDSLYTPIRANTKSAQVHNLECIKI